MCAPPVRSLVMDMMILAVRMQVFGIVHSHAGLQIKSRKLGGVPSVKAKIAAALLTEGDCPDPNPAQRKGGLVFRVLQRISHSRHFGCNSLCNAVVFIPILFGDVVLQHLAGRDLRDIRIFRVLHTIDKSLVPT